MSDIEAPWVGNSYDRYRDNYYGYSGREYDGIIYVKNDDEDEEEDDEF